VSDGVTSKDDCLKVYANAGDRIFSIRNSTVSTVQDKNFEYSFEYYAESGCGVAYLGEYTSALPIRELDNRVQVVEGSWQTATLKTNPGNNNNLRIAGFTTADGVSFDSLLSGKAIYFKNFSVKSIGCTLQLESENLQPVPGQWLEPNGHHAKLPAAGCTLMQPERDGLIEWTNTWSASSAGQYVGGINENIFPSDNIRIEWIRFETETTGVNITLGDQSDTDRYVESVALENELDVSSPAKRNHDGTNLKLVITPSGSYTGSIKTTVKYTLV